MWVGWAAGKIWQAQNSAYLSFESWAIWWSAEAFCWSLTWFLWVHIDQTIIAKISRFFCYIIIHDSSSLKSRNWTVLRKCHSSRSDHTTSSSWQDHKACSGVSWTEWQRSHIGSLMIVWQTRLAFVGMAFKFVALVFFSF